MQIYISGAITNNANYKEHFRKAEDFLDKEYDDIFNPAFDIPFDTKDWTWNDYMRYDLWRLLGSDTIYMLKGWEMSKGAVIEFNLAVDLGFKIIYER